jgi:superfamily II DNA or RNA helicase
MNYTYQKDLIEKSYDQLKEHGRSVLAATPGAGKTNMAIEIADLFLSEFKDGKVIVLAHGQTLLRKQFADRTSSLKNHIKAIEVLPGQTIDASTNDVFICLPQGLMNRQEEIETLAKFKHKLLIVDEAHEFYLADMVQEIIEWLKPTCELLLTGSPSKFIAKKLPLVSISAGELLEYDVISDPHIEIAHTGGYQYSIDDYNKDDELKSETVLSGEATLTVLEDVLNRLKMRLESKFNRTNPTAFNYSPEAQVLKSGLKKTLFVCKNQNQAEVVYAFWKDKVKTSISISRLDPDSKGVDEFIKDDECKILIVVDRGILGFDCPELMNVIDMSGSLNVDTIFQLLCRVIRKNPNDTENKFYMKVCPTELAYYTYYVMSFVVALSDKKYYETYDGQYRKMRIPVKKGIKVLDDDDEEEDHEEDVLSVRRKDLAQLPDLPELFTFTSLNHKDDNILASTHYTTLREVKNMLYSDVKYHGYWTLERCQESAKSFLTITDWHRNNNAAYGAAWKNNWIDKCTIHMDRSIFPKNYWTKEKCIEDALRYKTRNEWSKNNASAMSSSKKNGWYDECSKHMEYLQIPNGYWTLERCKESALKYKTKSEWSKNESGAYAAVLKNKWLDECCKHMKIMRTTWTLRMCKADAKKYKTKSEWMKSNLAAYSAAHKKGFINDCCEHMEVLWEKKWTLEKCKEISKSYNTRKKWETGYNNSYSAARKHGWLDECCAHMKKRRKNDK